MSPRNSRKPSETPSRCRDAVGRRAVFSPTWPQNNDNKSTRSSSCWHEDEEKSAAARGCDVRQASDILHQASHRKTTFPIKHNTLLQSLIPETQRPKLKPALKPGAPAPSTRIPASASGKETSCNRPRASLRGQGYKPLAKTRNVFVL